MKPSMKGPSYDVVTRVFKACSKKKVLVPGRSFVSSQGSACIQASFKANDGHLFFLEKSFFFLKKPPMHIRHAAITSIEFDRLGAANKRFGMKMATSDSKQGEYTFTNIAKDEFDRVVSFMQSKGIHCITTGGEDMQQSQAVQQAAAAGRRRAAAAAADDFSEDPYMKRLDAAAEEEDAEGADGQARQAGADESDSENDEDFTVGSGESDGSASGSGDSSDSGIESEVSESDDESAQARKKKSGKAGGKAKRGKKGAAVAADGSDDGGSEEESKSARPKKKAAAGAKKSDKAAAGKAKAAAAHDGPTGYQLYAKQNRPLLMIDTPTASFGDISKKLGNKWRAESDDVRAEFDRKASEARKELQAKREAAGEKGGDTGGDNRGLKRKKPAANTIAEEAGKSEREESKEMEVDDGDERKEGAD